MKRKLFKNKKSLIFTSITSIIVISLGVGIGLYFGQEFLTPSINYGQYDIVTLEDDNDKLYEQYKNTDASKYSEFESYEMVNIGFKKLDDLSSYSSTEIGEVNASGIVQTIYGKSIKRNSTFFSESISNSSLVKVAKRFYQEGDATTIYTGSVENVNVAKWDIDSKEELGNDEFENIWGKNLSRDSIYIISSKTVLDSKTEKLDNGFKVELSLDPVKSVIRYVKQMSEMSELSRNPEFTSVNLTVELDSNLNLLSITSNETYDVWKFGKHTSNGKLIKKYDYNEENIPDLNTNCNY